MLYYISTSAQKQPQALKNKYVNIIFRPYLNAVLDAKIILFVNLKSSFFNEFY